MNTHTAFHRRMLRTAAGGHAAYDIALRVTSGYLPETWEEKRLNQTLYDDVAREMWGMPSGYPLKGRLQVTTPFEPAFEPFHSLRTYRQPSDLLTSLLTYNSLPAYSPPPPNLNTPALMFSLLPTLPSTISGRWLAHVSAARATAAERWRLRAR